MPPLWPGVGRWVGVAADSARALADRLDKARLERHSEAPGGRDAGAARSGEGPQKKASREPRSLTSDPYDLQASFGYKDRATPISYSTLRELVYRVPIVSSIIQVRTEQVASFGHVAADRYSLGFRVKLRDAREASTPGSRKLCQQVEQFILRTGVTDAPQGRDSFETYLRKIVRDALTFDQNCTEIVPARDGRPAEFYAVDAANIRIARNLRKYVGDDAMQEDAAYVEVWQESVRASYTRNEMIFGVRNPSTDIRLNGYGTSEMEFLLTTITQILNAWNYNANAFENGNMARGLLNIKDPDIGSKEMGSFAAQFDAMLRGVENAHRVPVINAPQGVEYVGMQGATDHAYREWMDFLIKCTCFVPDTAITRADQSCAPIQDIRAGDEVITHLGRPRRVLNTQSRHHEGPVLTLVCCDRTLVCTPEHPFYVRSLGEQGSTLGWKEARHITAGDDYLLVPKQSDDKGQSQGIPGYFCERVSSITSAPYSGPVHNMEVEGDNSYLAGGVAAHNCASFKISPEEIALSYGNINQSSTLSEASNRDKIVDSKERGLRPLLRHIAGNINSHLVWPLSEAVEFEFVGLDSMPPEERADFNNKRVRTYLTVNEVRAEEDLPALLGGDTILDAMYMQQAQMAQQQGSAPNLEPQPSETLASEQDDAEAPQDTTVTLPAALQPFLAEPAPPGQGGPQGVAQDILGMAKSARPKTAPIRLDIKL